MVVIHQIELVFSNHHGNRSDDEVVMKFLRVMLVFVSHSLALDVHFSLTHRELGRRQIANPQLVDPPGLGVFGTHGIFAFTDELAHYAVLLALVFYLYMLGLAMFRFQTPRPLRIVVLRIYTRPDVFPDFSLAKDQGVPGPLSQ
jgi:hypothetical protein